MAHGVKGRLSEGTKMLDVGYMGSVRWPAERHIILKHCINEAIGRGVFFAATDSGYMLGCSGDPSIKLKIPSLSSQGEVICYLRSGIYINGWNKDGDVQEVHTHTLIPRGQHMVGIFGVLVAYHIISDFAFGLPLFYH